MENKQTRLNIYIDDKMLFHMTQCLELDSNPYMDPIHEVPYQNSDNSSLRALCIILWKILSRIYRQIYPYTI